MGRKWNMAPDIRSGLLNVLTKFVILVLVVSAGPSDAMLRRCFACRSRGVRGDCRDPFYVTGNSTTPAHKSHGVKTPPCASGWCSKILEDVDKVHTIDESY